MMNTDEILFKRSKEIRSEFRKLRVAFVKQEIYQDLYTIGKSDNITEVLFSSSGRVGPIGLFTLPQIDFLILEEEYDEECQVYKTQTKKLNKTLPLLKYQTIQSLEGHGDRVPGSIYPNGFFAQKAADINWSQYDIVISINISIPKRIVRKHRKTFFCYMMGENEGTNFNPDYGYDATLVQETSKNKMSTKTIHFPYTFCDPYCIENILLGALRRQPKKKGVYLEIKSYQKKSPDRVPSDFREKMVMISEEVNLHQELIAANLEAVYDSKVYVKIAGQRIRGNGAVEAISAGTPVILDEKLIIHQEILGEKGRSRSLEDTVAIVREICESDRFRAEVLAEQRSLVFESCYLEPLSRLLYAYKKTKRPFIQKFF